MLRRLVVFALLLVMAAALMPTGAALADGLPTDPVLNDEGCSIYVEFDAQATGHYEVWIWVDGKVVQSQRGSGNVDDTLVFQFLVTEFGAIVPGVAVAVMKDGVELFYEELPEIAGDCAESLEMACSPDLPAGAVVGQIMETTPAYFAPNLDAVTSTILPAGQTWWVLGPDATGEWNSIVVSCEEVWVPASALGPNYDNVWGGAPLPSNVVEFEPEEEGEDGGGEDEGDEE